MSCQDVVDAAQRLLSTSPDEGNVIIEVSESAYINLIEVLDTYKKEKHFVSGTQVLKEYIPDYEKPCKSVGGG